MKALSRRLVQHAHALAKEIHARAVVIYADALDGDDELRQVLRTVNFPTILFTRGSESPPTRPDEPTWIAVPGAHTTRTGQARLALVVCLARGVLHRGDRVVCLTGPDGSNRIDTAIVLDLGTEPELFAPVSDLDFDFDGDFSAEAFERLLWIATRIGAEGREGRPVGTIFVLGDAERVLAQSRQLILNPFAGHPESERLVISPLVEETLKELALVDGAFIVRGDGVVLAAGAQLDPQTRGAQITAGLGTRHAAAAAISASTSAVAFAVSQSTGTVTVFKGGRVLTEIHRAAGHRAEPRPTAPPTGSSD